MGIESEHNNHGEKNHSATHPFTEQEQILINMAHKHAQFEAHHHHAHHKTIEYQRPKELTYSLGLFALKKLNAMNPELLKESEKGLLKPSAPGAYTHTVCGLLLLTSAAYGVFAWKRFGLKGFINPIVSFPLGALIGTSISAQWIYTYVRQWSLYIPRNNMVTLYSERYGPQFLLDVLEPSYRLPESLQ